MDDAGIRLAPTPIDNASYHVMPTVVQEYVIRPQLVTEEPTDGEKRVVSTIDDYQPKREDANKKWKRGKRAKNMVFGAISLVVTLLALLPYVLGVAGVKADMPFKLVLDRYDAIGNLVAAFKDTAALGWKGDGVGVIWAHTVPDLILIIGILCLIINLIKSVYGLFGAIKPVKYAPCAIVNFCCVLAVFIASLVGAETIGIAQIDFMQDFIRDFANSELFTLVVFGGGNALVAVICALLNRDKCGYLK